MGECSAIGVELAETLGFVYNPEQRSLESILAGTVDGFVAIRGSGSELLKEGIQVRLFIYDYLPRVSAKDDIKLRPNVYLAKEEVGRQLRKLLYDHFFIVVEGELFEVPSVDFKTLFNTVFIQFLEVRTTDYFYL